MIKFGPLSALTYSVGRYFCTTVCSQGGKPVRRCFTTLSAEDSHRESMRLDGPHEQAITSPLSHDELVQLHCIAAQARVAADLAGQGDDLARAA